MINDLCINDTYVHTYHLYSFTYASFCRLNYLISKLQANNIFYYRTGDRELIALSYYYFNFLLKFLVQEMVDCFKDELRYLKFPSNCYKESWYN